MSKASIGEGMRTAEASAQSLKKDNGDQARGFTARDVYMERQGESRTDRRTKAMTYIFRMDGRGFQTLKIGGLSSREGHELEEDDP
jgi:hypothetical protein